MVWFVTVYLVAILIFMYFYYYYFFIIIDLSVDMIFINFIVNNVFCVYATNTTAPRLFSLAYVKSFYHRNLQKCAT